MLDSGVAIAWFFSETESERLYAAGVLRLIADGATAYVPELFHIEVAEFLLRRRRTRAARFSQTKLNAAFDDLDGLGLQTVITIAMYRDIAGWVLTLTGY